MQMTREQLLLVQLIEECGEVIQEASKALRFGVDEVMDGQDLTNAERIAGELADLQGVIGMLTKRLAPDVPATLDESIVFSPELHHRKQYKVEKWLRKSKECGVLRGILYERHTKERTGTDAAPKANSGGIAGAGDTARE